MMSTLSPKSEEDVPYRSSMGKRDAEGFTPDERKLFTMLSDGRFHTKEELHTCLWDHEQSHFPSALKVRLSELRKRIRSKGMDVVSQCINGVWGYALVRRIGTSE